MKTCSPECGKVWWCERHQWWETAHDDGEPVRVDWDYCPGCGTRLLAGGKTDRKEIVPDR